MSFILTSRTRDRQPQGEARLNKAFPSASKIVAAIPLGFSNRDLVSGRSADQGANVNVSGARGLASRDTGNASTAKLSGGLPIGGSKLLTVSWWMNWEVELSNQAATVGIGLTDGSQRGFWFEIDSSTTMAVAGYGPEGYPAGFWKGVWQKSDANFTSNVGKWRHYMLSFDRNSATCCGSRLWIDGVQMPDPSSQGNNAPGDWSTTANLYVSGPPGTPTKTSQTQNIVVRSGYYGTTADARFEYQNAWQLFAPERTPVFYSLPSSSPTVGTIWTSKTRTRQPTRFARADTGRLPITHLWSGSAGVGTFIPDAAGTAHGTKGTLVAGQGYSIKPTADAVAIEFDTSVGGTHSQIINLGDASGSGGPRRLTAFTLFMEFMVPSIGQAVFYSSEGGGLQFSLESGGILNLVKSNTAVIGVASTAVATANVWHKAAVSYDGTNYQFVLDGAAAGSGSNAVTISPVQQYFGGLVSGVSFGAPPNGSKLKTFAVIDKVCSVEDMSRLCANPWQLFAPERTTSFYGLSSGGGSTTANRIMLLRRPGLSRIWR